MKEGVVLGLFKGIALGIAGHYYFGINLQKFPTLRAFQRIIFIPEIWALVFPTLTFYRLEKRLS
ncbi:MAG: hypothetical protein IPM92_09660 [Saprospiraceae bacterium]|nr:hypothetical protein [Saprospiraceae bacterium]